METLIINALEEGACEKAAEILKKGGIVAIPTETVYGLAGNAFDGSCVEKIYKAKGRPSDNPLIVHISHISQWAPLVKEIPEKAQLLADRFWPGPLTIILEKSSLVPDKVSGGLSTVAVRMPENKTAKEIIEKAGFPLAAPSANLSGKPSPTSINHVKEDLWGRVDAIVEGEECKVGVESTVISLVSGKARILRPGSITPEMIRAVIGETEIDSAVYSKLPEGEAAASPGMKYKHYSPKAKVILVRGCFNNYKRFTQEESDKNSVALCFEEEKELLDIPAISYGKKKDPDSQAKQLFSALRQVDKMGYSTVYARIPDDTGVGLAVFNRLIRAAAFTIKEV